MGLAGLVGLATACAYRPAPLGDSGYTVAFPRGTGVISGPSSELAGGLRWRAVGQALDTSSRFAFAVLPARGTRFDGKDVSRSVMDAFQAAPGVRRCLVRSRQRIASRLGDEPLAGEQAAFVCPGVVARVRVLTGPSGYFVLVLTAQKELGLDPGEDRSFLESLAVDGPAKAEAPRAIASPAPEPGWFGSVDFR